MSKAIAEFQEVEGLEGAVYTARKGALRCSAIRLKSGGLCLYSPVLGLDEIALRSVGSLGQVTHLLAPNHYHHKGLSEYRNAFPNARLCCSTAAKPRLEKQTGLSFTPFEDSDADLPVSVRTVEPEGLKTGEVWVQIRTVLGMVWIVTDAFCGAKDPAVPVTDQPQLLGNFPSFGIADRAAYLAWLSREIEIAAPTMIIPCHGTIIRGQKIGAQARELIENLA